jgi:quercetin dioxygenase-like cupin family protein
MAHIARRYITEYADVQADALFRFASQPLEPVREGIRRRSLVLSAGLKADEIFFYEGVATTAHAHPLEQAAYTVSGEFEVTLGDSLRKVGPGDAYGIPAGLDHAVRCVKEGSYLLITALTGSAVDDRHSHDDHHGHDHGDHHGHDHDHGHHH